MARIRNRDVYGASRPCKRLLLESMRINQTITYPNKFLRIFVFATALSVGLYGDS